jgi:hypothetical protein
LRDTCLEKRAALSRTGCNAPGFLSPEAARCAARIGEDFEIERLGAEAMARRGARWREFEAAAIVVARTRTA